MRVGGGVVEESISWSDSSSSSWSSNEVEMQYVNHPMPMPFKPKQVKPCLKLATTTTKTTTTENPYCGNNNQRGGRKVVHFEVDNHVSETHSAAKATVQAPQ